MAIELNGHLSLICLSAEPVQKLPKVGHQLPKFSRAHIGVDQHRAFPHQSAVRVLPSALHWGQDRDTSPNPSQQLSRLQNPSPLVANFSTITVLVWHVQRQRLDRNPAISAECVSNVHGADTTYSTLSSLFIH